MEDIKVSVVMPMKNVKRYIRECMDSVVNQTLKEIEVICVDAYSTDGSREIVEEYAHKDKRVRLINDNRGSTGYSNNIGIRLASGKYVAILETDDHIAPSMYETLYSIGEKENCDVVRADYKVFWGDGDQRVFLDKPIVCEQDMYGKILSAKQDKKIFLNFSLIFKSLGTCLYPNEVLSTHAFHVIPVLVLLWFPELALFRVFLCYLTLFSQAHLFQSQLKTTR